MGALKILFALAVMSGTVMTTIRLRYFSVRGSSAVVAGSACLHTVAEQFFYIPQLLRSKNMVILHTANLSAPAAEIGQHFLALMHNVVADGVTMQGVQLLVLSDGYSIDGLINVVPSAITLTDYYVLVTDDLEKLSSSMSNVVSRSSSYNPAGRFLILFNSPEMRRHQTNSNGEALANQFFRRMYTQFHAANVIFCYSSGIETYSIFITDPYRNTDNCGSLRAILVDICNNGRMTNASRTSKALRESRVPLTMPGCQFTLCARVTEPYVEAGCIYGMEMEIVKTLQDILEFELHLICMRISRGERNQNGSWTNLMGLLRNDECQFIVGNFFPDYEVHNDFGVTTPYLEDSYTWYVAKANLRPHWKRLIMIFQPIIWLLFIFSLLMVALAWYIFGITMPEAAQHRNVATLVMNAWCVFLGISTSNRPSFTPLRILFVLLALYGLNVTTIYTSKLITVFTEPLYESDIDTIAEILSTDQKLGGREDYKDWFYNDNPNDKLVARTYQFTQRFQPTMDNLKLVRDGVQAMLMNRFFVLSSSLRESVHALPGNVLSSPMEMITERGFPLLNKFNRLISYMQDAGIMDKIRYDFIYNMTMLDKMRHREHVQGDQQMVLTVQHLGGAFALLIVGAVISVFFFVGELISISNCSNRWVRCTLEWFVGTKATIVGFKLQEPQLKAHNSYKSYI